MREALVIIGNGMAANRLVEGLRRWAPDRYAITVIGDEPGPAYNRVLLSSLLAGDAAPDDLALTASSGVNLITGTAASGVNLSARSVRLTDGRSLLFSKLVFATGSRAARLPVPGADLPGVAVFRTMADTEELAALADRGAHAVVIGGGLLGIEAAYGLACRGARVTLVHLMDRLMERQLDAEAAGMVKAALAVRGITMLLNGRTTAITGEGKADGIALADGRRIKADAVVMAAGIVPNAGLAQAAGLATARGIIVNGLMEATEPGVYAIGECAELDGQCCGLVEPAYEQADVLARRLAGDNTAQYTPGLSATNLKVSGLPVFSAGDFLGAPGTSSIRLRDPGLGLYKKLVVRDGVLTGAVLVGDTADGGWYLDLIRKRTPVSQFRDRLAFGRSFCEPEPVPLVDMEAA